MNDVALGWVPSNSTPSQCATSVASASLLELLGLKYLLGQMDEHYLRFASLSSSSTGVPSCPNTSSIRSLSQPLAI